VRLISSIALSMVLAVSGCMTAEGTGQSASVKASDEQFAFASQAAKVCSDTFPDEKAAETKLKSLGYNETGGQAGFRYYRSDNSDVILVIGRMSKERICIVGLENMTPDQSYNLALPWVNKYRAVTNAERGQGLSKKVVQAWASFDDKRNVYIAANKSWQEQREPFPKTPGASIRLIYLPN
jgi:hypothetical protein